MENQKCPVPILIKERGLNIAFAYPFMGIKTKLKPLEIKKLAEKWVGTPLNLND